MLGVVPGQAKTITQMKVLAHTWPGGTFTVIFTFLFYLLHNVQFTWHVQYLYLMKVWINYKCAFKQLYACH